MVRLRREIEGIAVDLAIPLPPYVQCASSAARLLPSFVDRINGLDPGRLLLAGATSAALVDTFVTAGHTVTVCDVPSHARHRMHAELGSDAGGRTTIVDKPYGEAAFGPSSFDTIVHLDAMHRFANPAWAIAKMHRELKYDGLLAARFPVDGQAPVEVLDAAKREPHPDLSDVLTALERLCRGPARRLLVNADGRDAIRRGAHLGERTFALQWSDAWAAIGDKLGIEHVFAGHTQRLQALNLTGGARPPLTALATALAGRLPELADRADLASGRPRAVGVIARKMLGGRAFLR